MSKFSTPLLIILAIVAVVGIGGWRSAAGKISAATTELTTASNRLAEITTKLAEQGAATETLRVQLNLQKADLASASNLFVTANNQLGETINRRRTLESEVSTRDAQLVTVTRSNSQLQASITGLETQILALQGALETARAQVSEASKKLDTTAGALNEAESNKAALLAKLNDPSTLRYQLKSVTTAPAFSSANSANARLMLKPDGTVAIIPQPPKAPARESNVAAPSFSDLPIESTNRAKIILTY